MGAHVTLNAADGHQLDAYVAEPATSTSVAVVIVQEIFGVNSHIRGVADDYARQGFLAIAPALFDRVERHVELGCGPSEIQRGRSIASQLNIDSALADVAAAISYAAHDGSRGVGIVGFCFGGTLAWLAATRLNPAVAVGYYGGQIAKYAAESPRCPVMLHFGSRDAHIPASDIDQIRRSHPDVPIFLYDAGHGFNCDQRKDYDPTSAALARDRTLQFLREHLLSPSHPDPAA